MNNCVFVGLDVSKSSVDVCFLSDNSSNFLKISNNSSGFCSLLDELKQYKDFELWFCCEYTGSYYYSLAYFLYEQNYKISVVNPYQSKSYSNLLLSRTKTDKKDAFLLASFCKTTLPNLWVPPSPDEIKIKSFTRRLEQLVNIRTMEKNRQKVCDSSVSASLDNVIAFLDSEIDSIFKQLNDYILSSQLLNERKQKLMTITGIGEKTANVLLSVFCNVERFPTHAHLLSYLGLTPILYQSGSSLNFSRLSKMGDKFIRKSLYFPAMSACHHSKLFRSWFDYQLSRGKHKKQIYIMMMRKLIIYAYQVVVNNQEFNTAKVKKSLDLLLNNSEKC